ncbi:SPT3 Dosage dependent suppressor of Ty-induced promoter mutations-like protein [Rhodotorula sphaerocarpa]
MDYTGGDGMQYGVADLHQPGRGRSPPHDPDNHFDSSSSSGSDNHSSPADSSYTATSQHDWALDGLSLDLALPWSPGAPPTLAALDPGFAGGFPSKPHNSAHHHHHHHQYAPPKQEPSDSLALTNDFWSASPDSEAPPRSVIHPGPQPDQHAANGMTGSASDQGSSLGGLEGGVEAGDAQMDFEDMVHGDVCGPATLSPDPQADPSASTFGSAGAIAATFAPDGAHAAFSMPIDLTAVNAGITPTLTSVDGSQSGQATPERFVSPAPESLVSPQIASTRATSVSDGGNDGPSETYGLRRASVKTRSSRASTREHSVSRASDTSTSSSSAAQNQRSNPGSSKQSASGSKAASTTAAAASKAALLQGSVNLVARDAVQAAKLIPGAAAPSVDEVVASASGSHGPVPELLVLGVPTVGAKSRVETQIKISLALVRPRVDARGASDIVVDGKDGYQDGYLLPDGGLDDRVAGDLERLETWSHLRLPKNLALKSKEKKGTPVPSAKPAQPIPDPPVEATLNLEVAVVSATDPNQRIYICNNCEQRELKRSLRRKDSKGKTFTAPIPTPDPSDPPRNDEEERQKVVVFNAPEIVDFKTGEVVLPTRVTCYCRHHKEKKGFCIAYAVRDHRGHVIARGMSPAIMITDDHKTNTSKAAAAAAAAAAATEDTGVKRKGSKSAASAKGKKEKASSPSATSGRPPRRGASGRSRRGQTESDDDQESTRKSRPYDSDARPSRKRGSNQHRSPMFAMTPLAATPQHSSKPPSPTLPSRASVQPEATTAPAGEGVGAALGLTITGDADMTLANQCIEDARRSSISTSSIDWPAGISTPPLSPGSSAGPAVAEPFQSIFSGFPSPQMPVQGASTGLSQPASAPGTIPSFAIPATEPIPASFASSWALQQQPQQTEPPVAPPRINRVIPGEGPVHGGIEITVLGDNFVRDLTCVFGDNAAVPTHFWSANTLVCVLPPSANPGPVVVGIKGVPLTPDQGSGLQLFTYKDTSDRSLLELALQVVGMQMTGRIEDAAAIAMRIVANGSGAGNNGGGRGPTGGAAGPTGGATDTASLAATLDAATRSAYATPAGSQASSRRSSFARSQRPGVAEIEATRGGRGRETRNFEGIVIKFLSLLDLDPSLIPGAAPSLPSPQPPISLVNQQRHTLLHLAAVLGFHRLVSFLLPRGIALDAADRNGYTALHFAALYGRVTIARLLIEAGANTAVRTLAGRTPLDIAIDRDDIDVEDLLVASGAEASHTPASTPTLSASGIGRTLTHWSPTAGHRSLPESAVSSRRSSVASLQSRSSFFFEAGDDDDSSEAETQYPSDWTVDDDSWDENDEADVEESAEEELARLPRSRLASRNTSTVSLQYLLTAEAEEADAEYIPLAEPMPRADLANSSSQTSWLSQKLRPTAENVSTAWEKAKASGFGVPSMQMPDVGNALQLRGARRRRATESAVLEETDGNDSSTPSRFSASPFRDWTPAFKAPQWWHGSKAPSSPPPEYTPSDSLALSPPPEKQVALSAPVERPAKGRTESFRRIRSRMQRRFSSTSQATDDTDAETDSGSVSFEVHRPASLRTDVMLFVFWIPVLVAVVWYAYRHWEEYGGPVVATLADTLLPPRLARIFT